MRKFTVRFDEELYKSLQAVSLAEGRSMVEVIRESVRDYTQRTPGIEEIKELIARARSMGSFSEEEAFEVARDVAAADDEEGLGDLQHRRSPSEGDADA
jgi:predicted transcriptional regulator